VVGGTTIGTYTNAAGTLVFTFNSSATNALVNSAMQQIAYANSSDTPPASAQIEWAFSDGNLGAQGSGGALTATGNVIVNITAVNDAPVFTSPGSTATVALTVGENTDVATTLGSRDVDGGVARYSITGGADAALFLVDSDTGVLRFVVAPDFEQPLDTNQDNVYEVNVAVADGAGGNAAQTLRITVGDRNDAPTAAPRTVVIDEDGSHVFELADFGFSDPDVAPVFDSLRLVSAPTAGALLFDGQPVASGSWLRAQDVAQGRLRFVPAPDSHGDPYATLSWAVSDGSLVSEPQSQRVVVTAVNDAPRLTNLGSGAPLLINVPPGSQGVLQVLASDPDHPAQTLTFSIDGGVDAGRFEIDAVTGLLGFRTPVDVNRPNDSNGDNVYEVQVRVSDGSLSDSRALLLRAIEAAPAGLSFVNAGGAPQVLTAVDENSTWVDTLRAVHSESLAPALRFGIVAGADADRFVLDATSGVLRFATAPDFEAATDDGRDNVYEVTVQVSDGVLVAQQAWAIRVLPVNDNIPRIVSAGALASAVLSLEENLSDVAQVQAMDVDLPAQRLVYSVVGGADGERFAIDSDTGALRLRIAPDHEQPADAGADNVYDVVVQVSDGTFSSRQVLAVQVLPVNDIAPVFTSMGGAESALFRITEGSATVLRLSAQDQDSVSQPLQFSLLPGGDAPRFRIDASSGELSFVQAPRASAPQDSNADNVYDITVQVSDGRFVATQSLRVSVLALVVPPPFVPLPTPAPPFDTPAPPARAPESAPAPAPSPPAAPGGTTPAQPGNTTPGDGNVSPGVDGEGGRDAGSGARGNTDTATDAAPGTGAAGGRGGDAGGASRIPSLGSAIGNTLSDGSTQLPTESDRGGRAASTSADATNAVQQGPPAASTVSLNRVADTEAEASEALSVGLPAFTNRLSLQALAAQAAARNNTADTGPLQVSMSAAASDDDQGSPVEVLASPAVASGLAFTASLLLWVTRAGGLLAAMAVSVPAWRGMDPLPILQREHRTGQPLEGDAEGFEDGAAMCAGPFGDAGADLSPLDSRARSVESSVPASLAPRAEVGPPWRPAADTVDQAAPRHPLEPLETR